MPKIVLLPQSNGFDQELQALGLSLTQLQEIGMRILAARQQTTPHDAATASGSYAYLAGVRAIRDIMVPNGWTPLTRNNLELLENPAKSIHLLISSGDQNTGNEKISPKTRNKKGKQTKEIVQENQNQLSFWPVHINNHKPSNDKQASTWIFLHYFDETKNEMRVEISLPINFNEFENNIAVWERRIILPSIKIDEPIISNEEEQYQDIEFDIRRKKNE